MCGITGWYRRRNRSIAERVITAQCDTIHHRGPDDSGVIVDGDFGFGMRRLSILDVAGGHQPMESVDGRFSIVFNGEIYNHLEVRAPLAAAGYAFRTRSDTETILAAFIMWGNDCWAKLEGMFAVAVWDRQTRTLSLARDPLGIKPLYISEQDGGLSFASELKSLQILPNHRFTIDERAIHDFFSFGHVRCPRSIFREVCALDPAHYLTIGPVGNASITRYWEPQFRQGENLSTEGWVEQMRSRLLDVTARHMQSDVPVGVFLSGGIDSSAVLSAATRATDQPIKAFTIGYPDAKIDETGAARRIADHLGAQHIVMPLEIEEARKVLPQVLANFDEPFADMAAIPTWYASKLAAEHVKVVLCGEGGDELFAGYKRHRNAHLIERYRWLIGRGKILSRLAGFIPTLPSEQLNYLRQKGLRAAEFISETDGYHQFFAATQISSRSLRRELYTREFWERHEREDGLSELEQEYFPSGGTAKTALEQFLYADLTLNMPSAMLTRLDRSSMAHSLEARVPFLSHKMVDWAMTVPIEQKLQGATGKLILRRAIAPWLPPDIMKRPKQGFQIPHAKWFRGNFGEWARSLWHDSGASTAGYLDPRAVDRLFDEHKRGVADHGRILYAIGVFGWWWSKLRASTGAQINNAAA